jgi:hypothetical protein
MAQINLNKKIIGISILMITIVVCVLIVLNAKLSTITTSQPDLYKVMLANDINEDYSTKIKVNQGKYVINIRGPFFNETQEISVGLLNKKVIDVPSYQESERGIEEVIQEKLKDYDIFYAEVSDCQPVSELHFVCAYYRASSVRAVEAKYDNYNWTLNTDESKVTDQIIKNRFLEINARNNQR